ncbi:MAG: type II secretion system protein [Anaerolineae bacterium]
MKRQEAGFTLVELLVVIAIIAIVTGMLTTIFYQFVHVPRWGNARLAVDSDLRNAGLWLVHDGNEAWRFTTDLPPIYGTFAITRTGNTTATVTYRYDEDEDTLWRDYRTATSTTTIGVARHIAQMSDVTFETGDNIVVVSVAASNGDVSASQTYTVTMRVQ